MLCSRRIQFPACGRGKAGSGCVRQTAKNPPWTRRGGYSQNRRSRRVDLWLPGYKCQQLLFNFSRFSQDLHILPSQLDAGGIVSPAQIWTAPGRAGAYVPTDLGLPRGHKAGGAAAQSHFPILAYVLLVTFWRVRFTALLLPHQQARWI